MPSQNPPAPIPPLAINHIGVGVSDIKKAVDWYSEIMGFRLIGAPIEVTSEGEAGAQPLDVLGPGFRKMRQAHMTSANGVGYELFELLDPPHQRRPDEIEYWRSGFFHICVTHPDVTDLVRRIVHSGGAQLSKIWNERGGNPSYQMCYCRDPFGNVIEIYSHTYELMQGHR